MRPPELRDVNLVPSTDSMLQRLERVEAELTLLAQQLTGELTPRERAGVVAHRASLLRRKQWYLARIRTVRPIQAVDVEVGEDVHTGEAHG
jgi:hypothetical protein